MIAVATQRRLAILGALIGLAVFVAANAHLITVAFRTHPDCTLSERATAAKPAC